MLVRTFSRRRTSLTSSLADHEHEVEMIACFAEQNSGKKLAERRLLFVKYLISANGRHVNIRRITCTWKLQNRQSKKPHPIV